MWFLAMRQLLARKKQTLFVIGGILLGTGAYVTISGIMLGFQIYMTDRLIDNSGHVHISAREDEIGPRSLDEDLFGPSTLVTWYKPPSGRRDYARIDHPAGWFAQLDEDPRVIGYSEQLIVQGLAQRGTISTSVRIMGIDPTRQERVTNINDFISSGKKLDEIGSSGNRVIIGKGLLMKLGASLGENIQLMVTGSSSLPFRVVNTFETGMTSVDETVVYASIADAQKINQTPSQISDIIVRLTDVALAAPFATQFAAFSRDKVQSWDQENQNILSVFTMQTMTRNLMSLCILLVAGFGIYNILNMIVSQKRKEIGILRSMGFLGGDVSHLFLYQGLVFGLIGGMLGLVAGDLVCHFIHTLHIGAPGTTSYRNITVTYDWRIYLKAFALALGSSVVASWIPARSAGKLNPIDIIRSDGS